MEGTEGLANLYLNTIKSPVAKLPQPRVALVDGGNSVPQSPMRYDNSGRVIQHASGIVGNDADSGRSDDDGIDEVDEDEIDEEEDVVNLRLPIVDSYGDRGDYDGGVLRSSLNRAGDYDDGISRSSLNEMPIPSSLGTMKYADGRVYTGKWKNGQWDGHGSTTYPNGDSYEGDYEGDQRHGIGVYNWKDGRIFQGNFRNDQRNGHGVYKWPDGSTYVGGFLEGQRHGEGTYSVSSSSILWIVSFLCVCVCVGFVLRFVMDAILVLQKVCECGQKTKQFLLIFCYSFKTEVYTQESGNGEFATE